MNAFGWHLVFFFSTLKYARVVYSVFASRLSAVSGVSKAIATSSLTLGLSILYVPLRLILLLCKINITSKERRVLPKAILDVWADHVTRLICLDRVR